MANRLSNKVAIITGAASGIGAATAKLFASEGAKVVIADIRADLSDLVISEIKANGGEAISIPTDVSDPAQTERMVKKTLDEFGALHVLHSNAAILCPGTAVNISYDDWIKTLAVNLTGAFLCARSAIPAMKQSGGGSIIFTTSAVGLVAEKNLVAYATSKGGLITLAKQIALDYAQDKIRVNCLCPGWVDTPFNDPVLQGTDPEELKRNIDRLIPLGRQSTPEEMAYSALFLASEESSLMTAHVLVVDGGLIAHAD